MNASINYLRDLRLRHLLLCHLLNCLLPYVLYCCLSISKQTNNSYDLELGLLGVLGIACTNTLLRKREHTKNNMHLVAGCIMVLILFLRGSYTQLDASFFLYFIMVASIQFRTELLHRSEEILRRIKRDFYADVALVLVATLALAYDQFTYAYSDHIIGIFPGNDASFLDLHFFTEFLAFLMMANLLLRLYLQWKLERSQFQSDSLRNPFITLLVLTIILGLFIYEFGEPMLVIASGPFFLLFAPLSIVIRMVQNLSNHTKGGYWAPTDERDTGQRDNPARMLIHASKLGQELVSKAKSQLGPYLLHHLPIVVGIGSVVIVLTATLIRRKAMKKADAVQKKPSSPVRSWIRQKPMKRFLETNHPIRIQYQEWLHIQSEQGKDIRGSETPREFLGRLHGSDAEQIFTKQYEEIRYGKTE